MIRKTLYTLIVVALSSISFGQTNNELIKLGDAAMLNGQYTNAVYYYAFVLFKVKQGEEAMYYPYEISTTYKEPEKTQTGGIVPPESPSKKEVVIIHKLASAYLQADDYKNGEIWYEAAVKNPHEDYPDARFHYGVALMYNEQFEAAKMAFETYQQELADPENKMHKMATSHIASCQFALNPINTRDSVAVYPMAPHLSEGSTNFGIQYTSDNHVLFSSARSAKSDSANTNRDDDDKYLLDIYIAPVNANGSIGNPEKFPFSINSEEYHEGSAVITEDGNTIFYTKMDPANRSETKIYATRKFNNIWLQPFEMDNNINMDGFRSLTPFLSADGKTLYYASNRPGGEGGLDLWSVQITPDGQTSAPVNLGTEINTSSDEYAPFFHETSQTLYYSSGGHIGFGGQDIYYNKWDEDDESFGQTTNAGAPINSSADDSFFIINENFQSGFVTSNRMECEDCDSIYSLNVHCNQIYQITKPKLNFFIKGHVYDKETREIIPNALVEFKDVRYKWEHFEVRTDENGYYEHALIENLELFMRASMIDYFADKALVSTKGELETKMFTQDFYLDRIPKSEITIEGIEYDFDSANIRPESEKILDNLIEFLELNDNLVVEIRSHTDQRGDDEYNFALSNRRAQSVVDYLTAHGIPLERLIPKGYGETMPAEIVDEDGNVLIMSEEYIASLPKSQREEPHQRNRRTAFFVLEQK